MTLRVAGSFVDRAGDGRGVVTPEADITTRRAGTLSAITHRSAWRDLTASNTVSAQFGTFHWYFPPARSDLSRPQVTIITPALTTEAVVGSSNFVFDETERQWQLRDVFEAAIGAQHTLRIGGDVIAARFRLAAANTNPNGSYVVYHDGNIPHPVGRPISIADIPADVRVASYTVDARPQQVNLSQNMYAAFVEDSWRPSASITVLTGLRWDSDDLTSRGGSKPDLSTFQPRVSFNWMSSPREVWRGGIGGYAGRFPYAMYSDAVQLGVHGNAVLTYSGASAPVFEKGKRPGAIAASEIQSVPHEVFRTFARGLRQPMSWQSSLGYQRQIGATWGVSADVVWTATRRVPWMVDLNPVARRLTSVDSVPLTCASATSCPVDPYRLQSPAATGYRRLSTAQSGGSARYVALYASARHAVNDRWQLDLNWVWSHAQNNTEEINFSATQGNCFAQTMRDAVTWAPCSSSEWADANNDRRHRVTLRSVVDAGHGFTWSLIGDAETGVLLNQLAGAAGANGTSQYDLLGAGPIRGNAFIGNADRYDGVGRNAERLPGFVTAATSLSYRRALRTGAVEIRADIFNVLNALVWAGYANGSGIARAAASPARGLWRLGITPNQVTIAGCALSLIAAALTATGTLRSGAVGWLASRLLDGFDGLLARISGAKSLLGGFLDIGCDMLAYSAMAVAFAYAMPEDRMLWLAVLTGYVMAITSTLALSSLLEAAKRDLGGDRSIQFTQALAEGGETTIVYVLIAFVPLASRTVLVVWIAVLAATMLQQARLAVRLLQ